MSIFLAFFLCFCFFFLTRSGYLKSLYRKITGLTNKRALGFSKIHSFWFLIRIFDGCSSCEYFAINLELST